MTSEFEYVEKPFMEQLKSQGWETILSKTEAPKFDPEITLRDDFHQVIVESRLIKSLQKLNDWLTDDQIDDVVNQIKRIGVRKGLVEANSDFLNLILENPVITVNEETGAKSRAVRVIDFENFNNNDFLAINQFKVLTPGTIRESIIPDIVLFVNGIPVGVIECKYPSSEEADPMEEGITQLLRYANRREEAAEKEGNEKLFHYNQLMVSTTREEACIGTITSEYDHYLEWKDIYPVPLDRELSSQDKLIIGALKPENIIDLIQNFTIFTDSEKGKIKILARYHQYRAVNKTIDRLLKGKTPEDRSGVIWHTQGSGKSLSMVFLIRKIRTISNLKQFKIVIVTDRTDLEGQLAGTAGLAEKPLKIINTHQLMRELRTDTSNLIMVMVQKFLKRDKNRALEDDLPEYIDFPKLNDSEDILILVDEAHRSHGGLFGANITHALPYATKIGFTGTPLIAKKIKRKTYQLFGSYIDKYRMKESENDGSTLPIRYEGKTVKLSVEGIIDVEFEDMFASKTEKEKEIIKQRYGTTGSVLEAKLRIDKISKDIVKHYFENVFENGFKAQIVASSRLAAVRYKESIDNELKEYIKKYDSENCDPERLKKMKFLRSVARITWENNELPQIVRFAKEAKRDLGPDNINFKSKIDYENPNSGITFLIVKDMLLTGFDAPIEQVMYIDKRMTDHTLLQAIARVNRVEKGKDVGLIVDYFGITHHLKEALDAYSADDLDLDHVFLDLSIEIPKLKFRYNKLIELFQNKGVKEIQDYVNYQIDNKNERIRILEKCLYCLDDVKFRADFGLKFRLFLESMDILLANPAAKDYIPPMKAFGHIHARALYRFRDTSINIRGAGKKVRKLIDNYLLSVGIDTKIPPVEITSEDFIKEIEKDPDSRAKASEMEHAIRKHCKVQYNKDPAFYKKMSEKLEEILHKFEDNWDEQVRFMDVIRNEITERQKKTSLGTELDRNYLPFYDLILDIVKLDTSLKENKEVIQSIIIQIVDEMSKESSIIGFWNNPHRIKILRSHIDDILIDSGIEDLYLRKDKIVACFMKLAKNRRDELQW